jgi:hypothetical protein
MFVFMLFYKHAASLLECGITGDINKRSNDGLQESNNFYLPKEAG